MRKSYETYFAIMKVIPKGLYMDEKTDILCIIKDY